MNPSLAYLGIGVVVTGFVLVAFPIVATGHEVLDVEQESGFLVAPVGVVVLMFAAAAPDPRTLTVRGAFGNPDEEFVARVKARGTQVEPLRPFSPRDPVRCRSCASIVTYDLARCPRCGKARECRGCARPLGYVLERATCPRCGRAEAFCNCARLGDTPLTLGDLPVEGAG
jgi:hypothetical protein